MPVLLWLCLGGALVYGLVTFQFFDSATLMWFACLLCAGAVLALCWGVRAGVVFSSPVLMLVLAFPLLVLAGLLYAYSPGHAYIEAQKYLAAFSAALIAYVLVRADAANLRRLLWLLVALLALNTFLSIEAASSRALVGPILLVLEGKNAYAAEVYAFWNGSRMMTLLNANVTPPLNLMGIFLAGWLRDTAKSPREKGLALAAAGLLAMGFVLCVSLGSFLVGALAVLAAVLLAGRGRAADTLLYLVAAFVLGFVFSAAAYPFMGRGLPWGFAAPALALACAGAGCLLRRPMEKASTLPARKKWLTAAGLPALAVVYLAAALLLPAASLPVRGEAALRRVVSAPAGEYRLLVQAEGEPEAVRVSAACAGYAEGNLEQTLAEYELDLSPAADPGAWEAHFTAPAGTEALRLDFAFEGDFKVTALGLEGPEGVLSMKPRYLLLPELLVRRTQGLAFNQSAAERMAYFGDAMTIFSQSPVFGQGGGAFEVLSLQVQRLAYESKYVHSHYLQTLVATGVAGLLLWLAGMVLALLRLLQARRAGEENAPAATALLCCLLLACAHSAIDFDMSIEWFLVAVYLLLGASAALFDKPLALGKIPALAQKAVLAAAPALLLLLCLGTGIATAGMNGVTRTQQQTGAIPIEALSAATRRAVALDAPHAVSYKAAYVELAAGKSLTSDYQALAEKYAGELAAQAPKSQVVSRALMGWHLAQGEVDAALDAALNLPGVRRLDPGGWNDAFILCGLLMEEEATAEAARAAAQTLAARFDEAQAGALSPIELDGDAARVYELVD